MARDEGADSAGENDRCGGDPAKMGGGDWSGLPAPVIESDRSRAGESRCVCSLWLRASSAKTEFAKVSISSSPLCVLLAVGAARTSLTDCLRLAARTESAMARNSGLIRSSFDIATICGGDSSLAEIRDRKAAFVFRL